MSTKKKPIDGAKLLEDAKESVKEKTQTNKDNNKKENEMNKIKSINWSTIITVFASVAVTLGVVYAGYCLYQKAFTDGVNYQKGLSAQMDSEVTARVEKLKQ